MPTRSSRSATPQTIAKSLAIGDPADGYFASQLIRETGGWSEDVDDDAIIDAMKLLAETEGIWTETAGGVTLAVAQKLIEQGRIDRDESIVICITGNGLKTQEALLDRMPRPVVIKPTLENFEAVLDSLSVRHGPLSVASAVVRGQWLPSPVRQADCSAAWEPPGRAAFQ